MRRRRDGSPIDTSTSGSHAFTVKATSSGGQATTRSVRYTVLRPTNKLVKQPHLKPHSDGRFNVTVKVPHPGRVDILVTAWNDNFAALADVLAESGAVQPAIGRFVFARAHTIATHATTLHILVRPNARGQLLVAHHRYRVTLRLWDQLHARQRTPTRHRLLRTTPPVAAASCAARSVLGSAAR